MRDDVNLKLKRQQCKYQPNTASSSPRNILNKKNNNIRGYVANKATIKGSLILYNTNVLNYFINDHQRLCLLYKNDNSSIIAHSVTHRW